MFILWFIVLNKGYASTEYLRKSTHNYCVTHNNIKINYLKLAKLLLYCVEFIAGMEF